MKTRRGIKFFTLAALMLLAVKVFSYDNLIIHPELSRAAINIYNQQTAQKLTQEQISWIVQGSIDEDTDPRYLNHFYDPSTGKGLGIYRSAKEWSQDQGGGIGLTGNYSEDAILENYQAGNLERAYQGVGHILHLVQDMSVPAHTRNDPHPEGDTFEKWAQKYGKVNINSLNFVKVDEIHQAFNSLAAYSHDNFLSRDTINNINIDNYKYIDEQVDGESRRYFISKINDTKYKMFYTRNPESLKPFFQVEDDFKVSLDYWNMLSPKAVGYSAGVIEYFAKKFVEIDRNGQVAKLSFWQQAKRTFLAQAEDLKYDFGDSISYLDVNAQNSLQDIKAVATNIGQNLGFFKEATVETTGKIADKTVDNSLKLAEKTANQTSKIIQATSKKADDTLNKTKVLGKKIINKAEQTAKNNNPIAIDKALAENNEKTVVKSDPKNANESIPTQITHEPLIKTDQQPPKLSLPDNPPTLPTLLPSLPERKIFIGGATNYPETLIVRYPDKVSSSSIADFAFSSDEFGANFEYSLDEGDWTSTLPDLRIITHDGSHSLKVRSIDIGNLADPLPAEFFWEIDSSNPQLIIDQSPAAFTNSSSTVFHFSSNENADFRCKFDGEDWQECQANAIFEELAEGLHALEVRAADHAGNVSSSTVLTWSVDLTGPLSNIFNLPAKFPTARFKIDWSGSDELSGVATYDLEYRADPEGEWLSWLNTASTSAIFNKNDEAGQTIYLRIRARDRAGNFGDWSQAKTEIIQPADHLLISQLQIGGKNATDEFIELFNPTDQSVNLAGYRLSKKNSGGNQANLLTSLPVFDLSANSYYLIAHKDYDGESSADAFYSTDDSIAPNNTAVLYDKDGKTIDKIGFGEAKDYETSAFPDNPNKHQSLKRIDNLDTDNNAKDLIIQESGPRNTFFSTASDLIVDDLAIIASSSTASSLRLGWSLPAGKLLNGSYYDLRYQENDGNCSLLQAWASAKKLADLPLSKEGRQEFEIKGLEVGKEYCFALRVYDGKNWSALSNQVVGQTKCYQLSPEINPENLKISRGIANKASVPNIPDEHVMRFDLHSSNGFFVCLNFLNGKSCDSYETLVGGANLSRFMVEAVYDDATKLFTGQYRFCDYPQLYFKTYINDNGACNDGPFWGGKRWYDWSSLAGQSIISISNRLNSNLQTQYSEWISP